MIITKVSADGFKNLKTVEIEFDPVLNIISGENAQGKTNIIEALWLCTGCRSFRGTKDKDFININENIARISLSFKNKLREQDISIAMSKSNIKDKNITLNGVPLKMMSKLFGNFQCVIFTPEDLDLAKGSPENRRSYIDLCISQIKLGYASVINKYDNIIAQRNSLLKSILQGVSDKHELDVWDEQLSRLGSYISFLRYNYTKKLNILSKKLYSEISQGKEQLEIIYNSTVFKKLEGRDDYNGEMADEYLKLLKKTAKEDIKSGFTGVGIHRDDLVTKINEMNSRDFGSQGQNRSIALILKLSQAYILLEETGEAPVILLDDVLSELDKSRQSFIMSSIEKMQVIITCCNADSFQLKKDGKLFVVRNGSIL